ncbi:MAG: hypothetical protein DRO04_03230 [Candidatus Iainarchaeum archaeon]|uniref:PPM-type phosphatase domain-containing protein n=1 Tax=Candidatus Iainarchaeum sp. TaxID=3101447 RepID=A0A497JIE2_9ARCH|nr:MAG: hypothetical protein DRO04_03230 [Candidatus Diapherotrites archaeon]
MSIASFIISCIFGFLITYAMYLITSLFKRVEKKKILYEKEAVATSELDYGIVSNIGGRRNNEDSGAVLKVNEVVENKRLTAYIAAVADGAGGHKFGEVASTLSISSVIDTLPSFVQLYLLRKYDDKSLMDKIYTAFKKANSRILELRRKVSNEMIASTLSLGIIVKGKLFVGHVGDSAIFIYRPRERKLIKVTKDHSQNGVLYKAVGALEDIEPDIYAVNLIDGDIIILASDGAIKYTGSTIPLEVLNMTQNPHELAELIVNTAYRSAIEQGRKPDNITVVVVKPKM